MSKSKAIHDGHSAAGARDDEVVDILNETKEAWNISKKKDLKECAFCFKKSIFVDLAQNNEVR